jgi:hypothetical protein
MAEFKHAVFPMRHEYLLHCFQQLVMLPTLHLHVTAPDWWNSNSVFSVRYELNSSLVCCNLHWYSVYKINGAMVFTG